MPRYIVLQIPTDFAALDKRLEIWGSVVKDRPHYQETVLYRHMKLFGKDDQRRWPDDAAAEARALSRGDYAEGWLIDDAWQSMKDARSAWVVPSSLTSVIGADAATMATPLSYMKAGEALPQYFTYKSMFLGTMPG